MDPAGAVHRVAEQSLGVLGRQPSGHQPRLGQQPLRQLGPLDGRRLGRPDRRLDRPDPLLLGAQTDHGHPEPEGRLARGLGVGPLEHPDGLPQREDRLALPVLGHPPAAEDPGDPGAPDIAGGLGLDGELPGSLDQRASLTGLTSAHHGLAQPRHLDQGLGVFVAEGQPVVVHHPTGGQDRQRALVAPGPRRSQPEQCVEDRGRWVARRQLVEQLLEGVALRRTEERPSAVLVERADACRELAPFHPTSDPDCNSDRRSEDDGPGCDSCSRR